MSEEQLRILITSLGIEIGSGMIIILLILIGVLYFLVTTWLKSRLEESIKLENAKIMAEVTSKFQKELEDYKNSIKIREQAARVADFLAYAFSGSITPREFNRLAWELSLWLPADLVRDISECLASQEQSKPTPKEVLIKVRKLLLQDPEDELRPENLLHQV